jgi:hypothetical protein
VFGLFNFLIPSQIFRIVRVTTIALAGLFEHLRVLFILNNLERQVDRPESGHSRSRNMLPSMQQEFFKDYSFSLFPQFPTAIWNYIWKISVKDCPARIVDLREYCLQRNRSRNLAPATSKLKKR